MAMHFVSAACVGEHCPCGSPAAHKLEETIPADEPCIQCGSSKRHPGIMGALDPSIECKAYYHIGGPYAQRHELTSYVCCACFRRVMGPAATCEENR